MSVFVLDLVIQSDSLHLFFLFSDMIYHNDEEEKRNVAVSSKQYTRTTNLGVENPITTKQEVENG